MRSSFIALMLVLFLAAGCAYTASKTGAGADGQTGTADDTVEPSDLQEHAGALAMVLNLLGFGAVGQAIGMAANGVTAISDRLKEDEA